MSKVKISRLFTKEFWTRKKKTEECTNIPESPVMVVEEKDESALQEKEKSQVLTKEYQQKEKKTKPQYIRTTLDEDVFFKFKMMCATMNIPMGIVTNRLIEKFVKKNENRVKMVINENPEV